MIKIEDVETSGWRKAIRAMRNPMSIPGAENNSWNKSDSEWKNVTTCIPNTDVEFNFFIGPNDLDLACRLIKAGPEHAKFLRMIHVQMDITLPLYLLKELDQYKIATTTNACSTMHRITVKPFTFDDFSYEHLGFDGLVHLEETIKLLNFYRDKFIEGKEWNNMDKKDFWWQIIQLLPSSYNQLRTWDGSMQTILSILKQRKGHKLDEWEQFRQACFKDIPYCKEFYEAMQ